MYNKNVMEVAIFEKFSRKEMYRVQQLVKVSMLERYQPITKQFTLFTAEMSFSMEIMTTCCFFYAYNIFLDYQLL